MSDAERWVALAKVWHEHGRAAAWDHWRLLYSDRTRARMIRPYAKLFFPLGNIRSAEDNRVRILICLLLAAMADGGNHEGGGE